MKKIMLLILLGLLSLNSNAINKYIILRYNTIENGSIIETKTFDVSKEEYKIIIYDDMNIKMGNTMYYRIPNSTSIINKNGIYFIRNNYTFYINNKVYKGSILESSFKENNIEITVFTIPMGERRIDFYTIKYE